MLSLGVQHLLAAVIQFLRCHVFVLDAREFVVNAIVGLGNVHVAISFDFSLLIVIRVSTYCSVLLVHLRCHLKVESIFKFLVFNLGDDLSEQLIWIFLILFTWVRSGSESSKSVGKIFISLLLCVHLNHEGSSISLLELLVLLLISLRGSSIGSVGTCNDSTLQGDLLSILVVLLIGLELGHSLHHEVDCHIVVVSIAVSDVVLGSIGQQVVVGAESKDLLVVDHIHRVDHVPVAVRYYSEL